MKPAELCKHYSKLQQVQELEQWLAEENNRVLHLTGMAGSSSAMAAACIMGNRDRKHVFILPDKETAAYFRNDLDNFLDNPDTLFFPSSYKRSVQYYQKSKDQIVKNESKIETQKKPKDTKPQKESDSKIIKKPEGIAFYDPRRPFKYWSGPTSKHKTYREAVEALAKKYQKSPDWIQAHMGDTNDLEELHRHKEISGSKFTERFFPVSQVGE